MKVTCRPAVLGQALQVVSRAISSRTTLPILNNILIETTSEGLALTATNLEIGIRKLVPAEVSSEGSTTAPARLLTDFVGQQTGGGGGGTFGTDLGGDELANADLEVGRCERQPLRRGLDEDVVQDGQGRPAGDGTRDDLQSLAQNRRPARDLHLSCENFGIQDSCPPLRLILLIEVIRN